MKNIIENATVKTTLTAEQRSTILEAVAEKVQAAIDDGNEVTAEISNPTFHMYHSPIESFDYEGEVLTIQYVGFGDPLEINTSEFLGCEELDQSAKYYKPTLFFNGLQVEIECE